MRTRNAFYASFRRINHLLFDVFSSLNRLVATNSYHFLPVATCNRDPWQPVFRKRCNEQRVTLARQPPLCVYPPRRSPNFHNKPIVPSKPTARPSSKRSLARRRDFAFGEENKASPPPPIRFQPNSPPLDSLEIDGPTGIITFSRRTEELVCWSARCHVASRNGCNEIDVSVSYHVPRKGGGVAPFLDLTLDTSGWEGERLLISIEANIESML